MASGVRTRIKQGHTTLRRTVAHAYACIRDHRQLLAAACHNLFKRHGSPTSTYNWNTPNIYIYICMSVENNFPASFVRWIPFYYDWRTINDDRTRRIKNRPSTKSPSSLNNTRRYQLPDMHKYSSIESAVSMKSSFARRKRPPRIFERREKLAEPTREASLDKSFSLSLSFLERKKGEEKEKRGRGREKDRRILRFVGLNQVSSARIGCNKVCTYRVHALGTRYVASSRWTWGTQRTGTPRTRPYTC